MHLDPPPPAPPGRPHPDVGLSPTWVAAAAVVVAVAAWQAVVLVGAAPGPRLSLLAAVAVLAVGRSVDLPATVGGVAVRGSLWAAATVVAAVAAPAADVVAAASGVAALEGAVRARRPLPAVVAAVGGAASSTAAVLVVRVAHAGSGLGHLRGWPVIAAAAVAAEGAAAAVGAVTRRRPPAVASSLPQVSTAAAACATSSAAAALAVAAATAERWSLLLLGAVAWAAAAAHTAHRRLAARHADLAALYELTQRLAGCSEEQDVLREVLLGVQQALSCQRSQLLVLRRAGPLRYALDDTTTMTVQQLPAAPAIVDLLVEGRDAVLAPRGARHHLGEALAASGFDDAMVVRLPSDVGDPRLLVVADRTTGTFTAADIPFLQTLAAQCAVSLRGTRLLDELRSEVASREHDALHDSLTRLGNRALFSRRCGEALARQRPNSAVVVMLLDLDGFKEINDTLGHHVGDLVLQQVAHRLRTQVGGRGVPTRLGGDEFAIVYPAVSVKADVRAVAREVSEAVSRPMDLGDLAITVQASIGISMAPGHGNDSATLLKCADVAMYAAKASAERISVYTSTGDQHSTRRLLLASELRRAAEAEELVLHYQPKADLQTGAVLGFEALLRWSHPTFGEVSPSEFIPVAEQAGLIDGMTWWVLAEALRQQRVWAAAGYDLSVAVNISARSLLDGRLASRLSRLLTSSGVPPERLVLEVTETSVMADAERSAAILDGAAALGVRISVDDFGTGYSSLSRLLEMPVHEIKVDRSFVTTMLQSSDNLAIVQSTVNLALSMGRKVTAEGVEDEATWEELRRLGCHAVQGYVLARAMAGERTVVWLGEYEAAMAQARADAWEAQRAVAVAVDGDGAAVGAPA